MLNWLQQRVLEVFVGKKAVCMIVSEQEGAEIFVNDQPTGLQTPHMLPCHVGNQFKLTLKHVGFQPQSREVKVAAECSYVYMELRKFHLRLVRRSDWEAVS